MFNLLPDSLKENITKEYKERRWVVILLFVIFIQASFIIFTMPSWVVSNSKQNDLADDVKALDSSSMLSTANSLKPIIKSINTELGIIDKNLKYQEFVPVLDAVISKKLSSIKITDVSYVSNSSSTAILVIQGVSSTRDALVNFKDNLASLKIFKNIDLPISNYTKDKNIDFSMTITTTGAI